MTKNTQIYLLVLVAIISAAAFLFLGGKPNMDELKKSVAPAASLYPEAKSVSVLLRGGTEHVVDEIRRAFDDAVGVVSVAWEDGAVLTGGGSVLAALSRDLRTFAETVGGREQMAIEAFASALEIVPRTLAENAGLDPVTTLIELRKAHADGQSHAGINVYEGGVVDMRKANVIEPLRVVEQAIQSATETAVMILRIDDVISSKGVSMGNEMGDMGDFQM